MNIRFLSWLVITLFFGALLYLMKNEVIHKEHELAKIERDIITEKENIHILSTELSYLTSPKRIRELANQKLDMQIIKTSRIISLDSLANKEPAVVSSNIKNDDAGGFIKTSGGGIAGN